MALTQRWAAGEALSAEKLNTSSIPIVSSTSDITTPYAGQIIFNTTDNTLFRYTGSAWVLFDANSQTLYKTANQSVTSSTTLVNDTHFAFSLVANVTYSMESCLITDGAAAGGLKMQFTGPAGAVMNWAAYGVNFGGGLADYDVVMQVMAQATPRALGLNGATAMCAQPAGMIIMAGTAGTLNFKWAQQASNATATRVLIGSWMRVTRIV